MSGFAKMQFFPQSIIEYPKFFADDILIFSRLFLSILSFKLLPSGRDTFMQILVLLAWGTARMEFALKFGSGGVSKGPATNFFVTHEAIVSVTASPYSSAGLEFFTWQLPRGWARKAGPPYSR